MSIDDKMEIKEEPFLITKWFIEDCQSLYYELLGIIKDKYKSFKDRFYH